MKKKSCFKCFFIIIISLIYVSVTFCEDVSQALIPSGAHQKAIEALKCLGGKRGALPISFKVVNIIGVVSEIKFDMKKIKENLNILKAKVTDTQIKIDLSGDVLFDFDKCNIREDANIELQKVLSIIKAYKSTEIIISGYTDSKGSDEYNLKLSLKRANSVKEWFLKNSSLPSSSLKTFGYGEKKPIASNKKKDGSDNPEGRQKNRRVEFLIKIGTY